MASKIKKGDNVFILSGKDKGKTGKVLKIIRKQNVADKAIVEGANIVKKHTKQSATQKVLRCPYLYQSYHYWIQKLQNHQELVLNFLKMVKKSDLQKNLEKL